MKRKLFWVAGILLLLLVGVGICFVFLPSRTYDDAYFHIETYKSLVDYDKDGIDDQTDFLKGVKEYIATKPKYKSEYYSTGYPNGAYGVCIDVVNAGFLSAGYDIQKLMNEDIKANQSLYGIEKIDANIDFRRVKNMAVYLHRHAISLTLDLNDIKEWQGGDIVVFKNHIGVLSDKRNKKGIPLLIHHANPYQIYYEEDVLERYEILGHYRIS